MWDKIFGSQLGGVGDLFQKIVGTFKLSPEKQAELTELAATHQFELQKIQAELDSKLADYQAKEIEASSANIRAETGSDDTYTKRARPTFMYMCELILGWNYIVVPLLNKTPINFPEPLFWLFGSAILGYTGARTWEKYANIKFGDK